MPTCVVRYCRNYSTKKDKPSNLSLHQFPPVNNANREKWIKFVQKSRSEDTWLPSKSSVICSDHFLESDKYITEKGIRRLKNTAIPVENVQDAESPGFPEPISAHVSDSESIFDTPRKIVLKKKLRKAVVAKKKLSDKYKKLQRQHKHLKKKCESYKSLVTTLKDKFNFTKNAENELMAKAEFVELHKLLLNKKKFKKHHVLYTTPLKKFALTLHYYSPSAYKYVRQCYNKALPHPRTICRWYSAVEAEPGFTQESFKILEKKCITSEKPVTCNLVFDEIAIRKQKLFHSNRKLGAVNFGAGPCGGEEDETVASQALVFMLVSLNENWKLPVGYFLIAGVSATTKANLINICLQKCHEVGVAVVSVTFDGCPGNISAAELLGCNFADPSNLKTYFPHPTTSEKIVIFIDPCHVIKLIRNAFERKRLIFDKNNNKIKWQLLINLNKLQQNEGISFANKLTPRHINFRHQIMKVKLATQLLSNSVAKALQLCSEELKSSKFEDSTGTVEFIRQVNTFFDIMNSTRSNFTQVFKRPIDAKNKQQIYEFLTNIKDYILGLKIYIKNKRITKMRNRDPRITLHIFKKSIVESSNKTGFLGALICIKSLKVLYEGIVEDKNSLSYISTYRISQDHLELFFGLIRKHGGYNNNPNVIQFRAAYKKTLNHLELRSSFSGNCIPIDNCDVLLSTDINSTNIINNTTTLNRHDNDAYEVIQSIRALESDLEAENNCMIFAQILDEGRLTKASKLIVGYISGYVSRALIKQLKCEECVDSLTTAKKLWHHRLITIKDMGGLCYSSLDVFQVCEATETIIKHFVRKGGTYGLASKYDSNYITVNALQCFIEKDIFKNLHSHSLNQPATFNHRIHLIRSITNKYTNIRLKHEAKMSNNFYSKRQTLTKLILFKGN